MRLFCGVRLKSLYLLDFTAVSIFYGIILSLQLLNLANAESDYKIRADSKVYEVLVPKDATKSANIWLESKGILTSNLALRIEAPVGAVVKIEAAATKKRERLTAISRKRWYGVKLQSLLNKNANKIDSEFTIRRPDTQISNFSALSTRELGTEYNLSKPASFYTGFTPLIGSTPLICDFLPPDQLEKYLDLISEQTGQKIDKDTFCSIVGNGNTEEGSELLPTNPIDNNPTVPTLPVDETDDIYLSNPSNGSIEVGGFLSKDACNTKLSRYLLRLKVDLSSVDLSLYPEDQIKLRVRAKVTNYEGKRAASIKPVSDGKFAPAPLILMSSVGGNQLIKTVRWQRGKPKFINEAPIDNLIYYRGFILSRTVASNLLSGGKATVEKLNSYTGYGVCLDLVRSRQRVNGYPGG